MLAALKLHWNWKAVRQTRCMFSYDGFNPTVITATSEHLTWVERPTEMPTDDTKVSLFLAKVSLDDCRMFWNTNQCGN